MGRSDVAANPGTEHKEVCCLADVIPSNRAQLSVHPDIYVDASHASNCTCTQLRAFLHPY